MKKQIQPTAFLLDSVNGYDADTKGLTAKERKKYLKRLVNLANQRAIVLKEKRKSKLWVK